MPKVKCEYKDNNWYVCEFRKDGYCTKDEIVIGTFEGYYPVCQTVVDRYEGKNKEV